MTKQSRHSYDDTIAALSTAIVRAGNTIAAMDRALSALADSVT
jgi:uncharacterized protein (DUF302 family)